MDTNFILQSIIDYFNENKCMMEGVTYARWGEDNPDSVVIEGENGIVILDATTYNI